MLIEVSLQGRPLGGATGAVAPGPAPRDERNRTPPPPPPCHCHCKRTEGGPTPYLAPGPASARDGPVSLTKAAFAISLCTFSKSSVFWMDFTCHSWINASVSLPLTASVLSRCSIIVLMEPIYTAAILTAHSCSKPCTLQMNAETFV